MTKEQAVLKGMREMLWAGLVYNDHNLPASTLQAKCRQLCRDAGIESVEEANEFLDEVARQLTQLKRQSDAVLSALRSVRECAVVFEHLNRLKVALRQAYIDNGCSEDEAEAMVAALTHDLDRQNHGNES